MTAEEIMNAAIEQAYIHAKTTVEFLQVAQNAKMLIIEKPAEFTF